MRGFSAILGAVAAWAACFAPAAAQPHPWPTKEFVIEKTNPDAWIPSGLNPFGGFTEAERIVVADFEKYLSDVAGYYEGMGFKPPKLATTKGRKGGVAYRVYMYDFDAGDTTAKAGFLSDLTVNLRIDYGKAIVKGAAAPRAFEDLAHELFHNVQRAYQTSFDLDHGDWIIEGQAQALGMEAARRLRGVDVYKGKFEDYRLGGRPYYRPLTQTVPDQDYRTASFWRYLAEHGAAAKSHASAGVAWREPDYSYLAKVYDHPFTGPVSEAGDLAWLDDGLRKATSIGLKPHYGAFAATFAGLVPARLATPPASPTAAETKWLDFVYGLCPATALTPAAPTGKATAALRKVAARCFKADIAGAGRVSLAIETRADTVAKLSALQIGVSGGAKIGPATIAPSPVGGGYIGSWNFSIAAGAPQVFIISNVDDEPDKTLNQDVALELTASGWSSSMTTPSAPAARPAPRPAAAPGPTAKLDERRAAARDEVAADLASRSSRSATGATAVFARDRSPCAGQVFAATGCGPMLSINLSLAPGAFGDLTQTAGVGGALGQFMSQMTAIADNGLAQTDQALDDALQDISNAEGSSVSIAIPLVEYGFTGSFDNASITVSGGAGAGPYQAIGPEDSIPGVGREYLHSGRVTIAEFTPHVLRGSFSADLVDGSRVEFPEGAVDYTLPVHSSISGEFVVASPWRGDPRVEIIPTQTTGAALQDMAQAFPALGGLDLAAIAAGKAPPSPSRQSYPTRTVGVFPQCACACAPIESYSAQCRPICEPRSLACAAADERKADVAQGQAERAALAGDVDRMRADFEKHLMENNMAELRDTMLGVFDGLATPEEKRMLLMSYGMSPAAYGADEVQRAAANPEVQTRTDYIRGLEAQGIPQRQIDFLVSEMDAFMAENGGWPEE